jgi:tetratricopeptide (TPR) repeat protein
MKGGYNESIREVDLAHTLDPAWHSPFLTAICVFLSAGQPERALAVARQLNQLEPQSVIAHQQLGSTYWYLGQYSRANQEWQQMAVIEKMRTGLRWTSKERRSYAKAAEKPMRSFA